MSVRRTTPSSSSNSSSRPTCRLRGPRGQARHDDPATGRADPGPGQLHRDLAQGLHAARLDDWPPSGNNNNEAFLARAVVMTANTTLSIPAALRGGPTTTTGTRRRSTGRMASTASPSPSRPASCGRGLQGRRKLALAQDFVRFLAEEGWLAHWLDFSGDRFQPPMRKLVEQPFWLDPSDPHRMRSAIQFLTRPHTYTQGRDRRSATPLVIRGACLGEGRPPRRGRGHQPRAGGRRGDRPDQADPRRIAAGRHMA